MTPSEARARESREWLAKADEDLASARVLIDSGHIVSALFFCQQAAEKKPQGLPDVARTAVPADARPGGVGEACTAIDGTLAERLEQADDLSDYAWKLRYPGALYTPELEEAEAALSTARGIFREIRARLGLEAGIGGGAPQ
jgi:HEPN domain-containing protein